MPRSLTNALRRRPGLGCLQDEPDPRDRDFARLGLASSDLPEVALDLDRLVPEVFDQGPTSSCVGQAFAQAVHVREADEGFAYEPVSRRALYYHSRRFHDERRLLRDAGTYPRTCARGLAVYGAPPERLCPFGAARINLRPSWKALRYGHARAGGEYLRIFEQGEQRILALRAALAAAHPVVFGTAVTDAFLSSSGPDRVDTPRQGDPIAGRHAMCVVGYRPAIEGGGEYDFRVVNSWGAGWRDGGRVWMSGRYLAWSQTADLWIVRGWRKVRGEA